MPRESIKYQQEELFKSPNNWVKTKLKYPKRTLRIGSLFSGIGAFEQALKKIKLDYEVVFASDNDKFVKESYLSNYKLDKKNWFDDVNDIIGEKYKSKIDLLVGGPPCQSFSMVGKRKGLEDARGNLSINFIKLVNKIRPKVFVYENVKSLLTVNKGHDWKILNNYFKKTGYSFYFSTLNAKDYGVPQNRERLFVVGFRNKVNFNFPNPIRLKHSMQDLLENEFDNKYYLPPKGISFVTKEKNLKKQYTQLNGKIALCQKRNQQFNWHGDFVLYDKDYMKKYYLSEKVKKYVLASGTKNFYSKPEIDLKVARPLVSTMHKMHRSGVDNYITVNKKVIRKLTPRECLRLQGFPDSFKQVVSDTQIYRQAGNSIVVDVITAILKEMDISLYAR
ncbi:DNA (cytosine-5-)-methyltransferase [Pelagibacteraceae bacterium]|nr:DNA (cytosine-5-)-methyltransferase [Pelagibacteraceae bacterium]